LISPSRHRLKQPVIPETESPYFYPIELIVCLQRFDNERAKIAIKRMKPAMGGAKSLMGLGLFGAGGATKLCQSLDERRSPSNRCAHGLLL
jgi:hypothetical protein